jgi:hypothetical protein
MGEVRPVNVVARRGTKALMIRALSRIVGKSSKYADEADVTCAVTVQSDPECVAMFSGGVHRLHIFPVRVKLALCVPPASAFSQTVYMYMCANIYPILTRSRTEWRRHIPLFYHSQKALLSSETIGDVISRLTVLITEKVLKNTSDVKSACANVAELAVQLFLASVAASETSISTEERTDASQTAAPICQLIWMAESMCECYTRMTEAIIESVDDQFTRKISPYRGLKLSRPTTLPLDETIQRVLKRYVGLPSSVPPDVSESGLIATLPFEEYVKELVVSMTAVSVFRGVKQRGIDIIKSFNSRHQKAANSRESQLTTNSSLTSLERVLVRPWADDVEIRAITAVYSELMRIVRGRMDLAAVYATVMAGAWKGIEQVHMVQDMVQNAHEKDTFIQFVMKTDVKGFETDWWRQLSQSYGSPKRGVSYISEKPEYMTSSAALRLQAWWRGTRLRRSKAQLHIMCEYVQNIGWPEYVLDSQFVVSTPNGSSLTRASLMRLEPTVAKVNAVEKPQTPASTLTMSNKQGVSSTHAETNYVPPDLIQADHIACARLWLIMAYSAFLRYLMQQYFSVFITALDSVSTSFAGLLDRNPQYQAAHDNISAELKRKVVKLRKQAGADSSQKGQRPTVAPIVKQIRESVTEEFLSKPLIVKRPPVLKKEPFAVLTDHNRLRPLASTDFKTEPIKQTLTDEFKRGYLKFFDGDDSLFRDISPNCCESMVIPPNTMSDMPLIWLPTKATRFPTARARLFSLIKGDTARAIFIKAESECEYTKCITLLSETEVGSLNVLTGVPCSAQQLWTELVYHLILGFIAQSARNPNPERGMTLIKDTIASLSGCLRNHSNFHRDAIEAMVFDAAIGFAFSYPLVSEQSLYTWYSGAVERYRRLGHQFRVMKCSLRYACVLVMAGKTTEARVLVSSSIQELSTINPTPLLHILKINRSILRNMEGQREEAEVEIREVAKASRQTKEFHALTGIAEKYKTAMSQVRLEKQAQKN